MSLPRLSFWASSAGAGPGAGCWWRSASSPPIGQLVPPLAGLAAASEPEDGAQLRGGRAEVSRLAELGIANSGPWPRSQCAATRAAGGWSVVRYISITLDYILQSKFVLTSVRGFYCIVECICKIRWNNTIGKDHQASSLNVWILINLGIQFLYLIY